MTARRPHPSGAETRGLGPQVQRRVFVHCRFCSVRGEVLPPLYPPLSKLTWFCARCKVDCNEPSPAVTLPTGRNMAADEYAMRACRIAHRMGY